MPARDATRIHDGAIHTPVCEAGAGLAELQQQDAKGRRLGIVGVDHAAVGLGKFLDAMAGAPDHELGDAVRTGLTAAIQRRPTLVVMVVAVEDNTDPGLRQQGPDARHVGCDRFRTNIVEWVVVINDGAGLGIGSQVLLQPLILR